MDIKEIGKKYFCLYYRPETPTQVVTRALLVAQMINIASDLINPQASLLQRITALPTAIVLLATITDGIMVYVRDQPANNRRLNHP